MIHLQSRLREPHTSVCFLPSCTPVLIWPSRFFWIFNPFQAVTKEGDGTLTLTLESGERLGGFDQILLATGRKPMVDRLSLGQAGVETNQGYITVGEVCSTHGQTSFTRGCLFKVVRLFEARSTWTTHPISCRYVPHARARLFGCETTSCTYRVVLSLHSLKAFSTKSPHLVRIVQRLVTLEPPSQCITIIETLVLSRSG